MIVQNPSFVRLAAQLFEDLKQTRVLFVGAGEMIDLAVTHFAAKEPTSIVIANRTLERGEKLASRFGGEAMRLAAPKRFLKIVRPIALSRGDKRIALYPSDHFKVTYSISFDHPMLRHQSRTMAITEESFIEEIAPARTFGFLKEVEMLRQNGLALGGSLENAIVIGDTGVLNALRFEDEFVRHKILDIIGDFYLLAKPIRGAITAYMTGHSDNIALLRELRSGMGL